jgi:hypothetical protein
MMPRKTVNLAIQHFKNPFLERVNLARFPYLYPSKYGILNDFNSLLEERAPPKKRASTRNDLNTGRLRPIGNGSGL